MSPIFALKNAAQKSLQSAIVILLLAASTTTSYVACNSLAPTTRIQQVSPEAAVETQTTATTSTTSTANNSSRILPPIPAPSQLDTSRISLDDVANVDASDENLDLGESGYLPHVFLQNGPPTHEPSYSSSGYSNGPHQNSYSYGDNQGKNEYAKQASDWSLYDQGAHGLHDKYGDKAWTDAGYQSHASHGKHDSHSNVQNAHGSDQGSGYYSRDRGYGYERQYAFDRVVDSKSHSNNHQQYANTRGLYDQYGAKNDYNFNKGGHEKYGLANKYGHGYRQLGSHDDYAHSNNQAVGHYPPPLYKSNYYSAPQYPQMPSYY